MGTSWAPLWTPPDLSRLRGTPHGLRGILARQLRLLSYQVSRLTVTGSDNGLSPGRYQAIIWTKAGILLIGPSGTNFSENLIEILTFLFTKMRLKVSSAKWRPFCLGLNVLMIYPPPHPLFPRYYQDQWRHLSTITLPRRDFWSKLVLSEIMSWYVITLHI